MLRSDDICRPRIRSAAADPPARGLHSPDRSVRGNAGAVSSVGRASRLHRECRRFESVTAHQFLPCQHDGLCDGQRHRPCKAPCAKACPGHSPAGSCREIPARAKQHAQCAFQGKRPPAPPGSGRGWDAPAVCAGQIQAYPAPKTPNQQPKNSRARREIALFCPLPGPPSPIRIATSEDRPQVPALTVDILLAVGSRPANQPD